MSDTFENLALNSDAPAAVDFIPAIDPEAERTPAWYVLRYSLRRERTLIQILRHVGQEFSVLRFEHRLRRKGLILRRWLPGYAFLRFDLERDRWQQIRRMPGALRFLGDPPVAIPEDVYLDLRARCPERQQINGHAMPRPIVPVGSEVRVCDGPFRDQTGTVSMSNADTVWVEMVAFNRMTRVELRAWHVLVLR